MTSTSSREPSNKASIWARMFSVGDTRFDTGVVLPSLTLVGFEGTYVRRHLHRRLDTTWIAWFADTLTDSAAGVHATFNRLAALPSGWRARLDDCGVRADSSARLLLDYLIDNPVLTPAIAATCIGTTVRAARTALHTLAAAGILTQLHPVPIATHPRGRHELWWYASDVTALVASR
jgi:hypothetical protein